MALYAPIISDASLSVMFNLLYSDNCLKITFAIKVASIKTIY